MANSMLHIENPIVHSLAMVLEPIEKSQNCNCMIDSWQCTFSQFSAKDLAGFPRLSTLFRTIKFQTASEILSDFGILETTFAGTVGLHCRSE